VAETLVEPLAELERAFVSCGQDAAFAAELARLLSTHVGRPTPLYFAAGLSAHAGGGRIYLKREDLTHTGAHKINNALGQGLLARFMGKTRLVADTGAGQHGVATATVARLLGLACTIYMGRVDMVRQRSNVERMQLLGATVVPVDEGTATLKDAVAAALQDWTASFGHSHLLLGSVVGPHPFPAIVRHFQAVIGEEARRQILAAEARLPDEAIACVGGGSNAAGLFSAFLDDAAVRLFGVQAGGSGGVGSAALSCGRPGVLHGMETFVIQDAAGLVPATHSIAAGLDYPAVGPEHSHWKETGRVRYGTVDDGAALHAFRLLVQTEGIMPALESAHAVAAAVERARALGPDDVVLVGLSGRGEKDLRTVLYGDTDRGFGVPRVEDRSRARSSGDPR